VEYRAGMAYHMMWKRGDEAVHVCLYGDVNSEAAPWAMDAADALVPDQAGLADHQKWSISFDLGRIRQYGEVIDLFKQVADQLEAAGWPTASAVEGHPDTGCTADGLVDTDGPEWWGKPEADWPREPNAHGYNAARGFRVVVERPETKPEFSVDEIAEIRALTAVLIELVFAHELSSEQ